MTDEEWAKFRRIQREKKKMTTGWASLEEIGKAIGIEEEEEAY